MNMNKVWNCQSSTDTCFLLCLRTKVIDKWHQPLQVSVFHIFGTGTCTSVDKNEDGKYFCICFKHIPVLWKHSIMDFLGWSNPSQWLWWWLYIFFYFYPALSSATGCFSGGVTYSAGKHSTVTLNLRRLYIQWWRHQMETFSALLAICAGNSPVTGEFPAQRPVTRSFDVFFFLCQNKRLSKQSWDWWFEMLSRPLWRHCNVTPEQNGHVVPGDYLDQLCYILIDP